MFLVRCIWISKQDICKASVKYITSIGDYDRWWRLQQHRSVSNEWMSKPEHLRNIEKSRKRPGKSHWPQLKIIHSQLIEKGMTYKDFIEKPCWKLWKWSFCRKDNPWWNGPKVSLFWLLADLLWVQWNLLFAQFSTISCLHQTIG